MSTAPSPRGGLQQAGAARAASSSLAKCLVPECARLLLLSRRLLLASEAFAADAALPQLDPTFSQLSPQHRQRCFQRGTHVAMW